MPPTSRRGKQSGTGFIRCYGLFWSAEEVNWFPGLSREGEFRLLGRFGVQAPKLAVCDFRAQSGIYVLYDDYGPQYVGLTRRTPIGDRLKAHRRDRHAGNWDRFSWFGFREVLPDQLGDGTRALGPLPKQLMTNSDSTIGDIEALLIQALGTHKRGNLVQMRFVAAEHWSQVMRHDTDMLLEEVRICLSRY